MNIDINVADVSSSLCTCHQITHSRQRFNLLSNSNVSQF